MTAERSSLRHHDRSVRRPRFPARFKMSCSFQLNWISWPLRILRESLVLRLAPHVQAHGVVVYFGSGETRSDLIAGKLHEAFLLVERIEPWWMNSLKRLVPRIVVYPGEHSGYWRASRSIVLAEQMVVEQDVSFIASGLIHETAHAYLQARGIRTTAVNRRRVERFCLEQQIRFVEQLPEQVALATYLRSYREKIWW
jgi:hypothetical protein